MNWDLDERQKELLAFTHKLIGIRQAYPTLRRRHFFRGQATGGSAHKDVTWLGPDSQEMTPEQWANVDNHVLGMLIDGDATDEVDDRGYRVTGDSLLLITNGGEANVEFNLPDLEGENIWVVMVDTARRELPMVRGKCVDVQAHSLVLLRFGADRRIATDENQWREPLSLSQQHSL
jgi:glycogen operon protein